VKRFIAIIVFISLLTQVLVHLGVWGYYQANKAYIAQNLCENRNRPQKNCCGKCYLRKQMKKVEDGSSTSKKGQVKTEKSEVSEFVVTDRFIAVAHTTFETFPSNTPVTGNFHGYDLMADIFHPPATAQA
jgi:hypothetical protein